MKKAVILLSGGLDSTTCLAIAKSQGFACHTLSFSYGQRHSAELLASARIAQQMNVARHEVVALDTKIFTGSALTDAAIDVPAYTGALEIPVTYVPARNTIFLSMALGFAESIGAVDIFIGVSSIDYSHYPDCREEYIKAFEKMANLATKASVNGQRTTIHAPLQHLSKAQTIQLGHQLGVDYSLTVSCYKANEQGAACGVCDSCTFRKRGFMDAFVADVTKYQ